jgi:beta-galactosidase
VNRLSVISVSLLIIHFAGAGIQAEDSVEEYTIIIGKDLPFIENQHFQQGTHMDPEGRILDLNDTFIRYDRQPFLPVMGEIHYSRYPKDEWEEALFKMKAGGIQIIAFYCFWLHHEEEEGCFRFDANRDVRSFIQLCAKHDLWVLPRIGPWCHGECRNGGFPDWFAARREGPWDRGYDGELDPAVKTWYLALAEQFEGLYFKQGGPIIGIQLDNEVRSTGPGQWGYQYLSDLRNFAAQAGMDVPFYTVTGWPGPRVPEDLVIGLFGAYPAAPWVQNAQPLGPLESFLFSPQRIETDIGSDRGSETGSTRIPAYRHPFLTAEMGGGNQITYHRRPRLTGNDMLALVYTRLGVGANMMGYYVFHGTQHPLSWNCEFSTQESRTGPYPYPNDYPMISYDFQAPLTEWGFIRDDYHDFKLIHQFLRHFGSDLAPMRACLPEDNPDDPGDRDHLRYAVRSREGRGYLFFNNYVRHLQMKDHERVCFRIQTGNEIITIPEKDMTIQDEVYGVFPFNFNIDGLLLKYATAHPFSLNELPEKVICFYAIKGIDPEFLFDKSTVESITVNHGAITETNRFIRVHDMKPGKDSHIRLISKKSGKTVYLLLFTREEARSTYSFEIQGREDLLISDRLVFYNAVTRNLHIRSMGENEFDLYTTMKIEPSSQIRFQGMEGFFAKYHVTLPPCIVPEIRVLDISDEAAFKQYCDSQQYHTPEGPVYSHRLDKKAPFLRYRIELPESLPENAHNLLILFDYSGNTAQIYTDSLLIADDYYSGLPMPFALRRHRDLLGETFILQITPLFPNPDIYFEQGTDLEFSKTRYAALNRITGVPEYEFIVSF